MLCRERRHRLPGARASCPQMSAKREQVFTFGLVSLNDATIDQHENGCHDPQRQPFSILVPGLY